MCTALRRFAPHRLSVTMRTLFSSHGLAIHIPLYVLTFSNSEDTRQTHCLPQHSHISHQPPMSSSRTCKLPTRTCQTAHLYSTDQSATPPLVSVSLYPISYTPHVTPSPVLPSALPYNHQNTRAHLLFHPSGSPPNSAFPTLLVSTRLTLMCFRGSYANRSLESYTRPTTVPKQPPPVYC